MVSGITLTADTPAQSAAETARLLRQRVPRGEARAGTGGPGVEAPGLVGGAEAQPSTADYSAAWFSALQTSEDASSWRGSPCITVSSFGATQVASQEAGM